MFDLTITERSLWGRSFCFLDLPQDYYLPNGSRMEGGKNALFKGKAKRVILR